MLRGLSYWCQEMHKDKHVLVKENIKHLVALNKISKMHAVLKDSKSSWSCILMFLLSAPWPSHTWFSFLHCAQT